MASQPLVTSCSLPDHSPRSVSWQVLNKQLGVLLTELGVIMLCNCGVRACLPVEIRNAKSFPVFKSKGKILTSDTGFPSFDYCGAPRGRLWRSLFRIPGSQTWCYLLSQPQRKQKMLLIGWLFRLFHLNYGNLGHKAWGNLIWGWTTCWVLCRNRRVSVQKAFGTC